MIARALLVSLLAALAAAPAHATAEDKILTLAITDTGFAPAELEVPTGGSTVRIDVTNQTGAAAEFESFELNRERVVQPGKTITVWVSGLDAGRYEFFDDFHQERKGALVVR